MDPLIVVLICAVMILFFGAGILAGYVLAKRGFEKRLVVLNTPEDYREQGSRLIVEAIRTHKLVNEKLLRQRAFEHFRMAETIEHTQPIPVPEEMQKSA